MSGKHKIRTEHAGPKNGGGFWGKRDFAKQVSREHRRHEDKRQEQEEPDDDEPPRA